MKTAFMQFAGQNVLVKLRKDIDFIWNSLIC